MGRNQTDIGVLNVSMGNNGVTAISDTTLHSENYWGFHCITDTVFDVAVNGTTVDVGDKPLSGVTHPAGTFVVFPFTAIKLVSGSGYAYRI